MQFATVVNKYFPSTCCIKCSSGQPHSTVQCHTPSILLTYSLVPQGYYQTGLYVVLWFLVPCQAQIYTFFAPFNLCSLSSHMVPCFYLKFQGGVWMKIVIKRLLSVFVHNLHLVCFVQLATYLWSRQKKIHGFCCYCHSMLRGHIQEQY